MKKSISLLFIAFTCLIISCKKDKQESADPVKNWTLNSKVFSGNRVLLAWSVAPKGCIGAEIKYTDVNGAAQTVVVPSYKTTIELLNYNTAGSSFQYNSMYLGSAGEVVYADMQTVSDIPRGSYTLPEKTSKYNLGGSQYAGRYKDANGGIKLFALRGGVSPIYDGGARVLGTVTESIKINMGTEKKLAVQGVTETYIWAWDTNIGLSGWMARTALLDPPALLGVNDPFVKTNPAPPQEAKEPLIINTVAGSAQLAKLIHKNSTGEIPISGNHGEDYAGRNPGALDYAYLCRAVPNVQQGGTSKDSMPNGSKFVPALDDNGRLMTEVMTMYRDGDLNKPVEVTFIYGRPMGSSIYGWIARANVGDL